MRYRLIYLLLAIVPASLSALRLDEGWTIEGWTPISQRPDLMPVMSANRAEQVLSIASSGSRRCNGSWRKNFQVSPGEHYTFSAEYSAVNVAAVRRSILVSIDWRNADGRRVGYPDFPRTRGSGESAWQRIADTLQAPEGAVEARVNLTFRWDEQGQVTWRNVYLTRTDPPPSREVMVASVNFRPKRSEGPKSNVQAFGRYVEMAGNAGAEIVCLPEGITVVGTGKSYLEVAEPVPGPTTSELGRLARKYSLYIVAGLYEQAGETVYNSAALIGPQGNVIGTYRKVCLPREEIEGGLTPGTEFPVFDTEFGRVGMMICWDVHFPEPARRLAARGAEMILLPIWGGSELLFPARAIENQVFLVTSGYDAVTGIWDRKGNVLSKAVTNGTIAYAKFDLAKRTFWDWIGDLRSRIPRESPIVREVD